eukprot:1739817-Prymnesium_polylepis.1
MRTPSIRILSGHGYIRTHPDSVRTRQQHTCARQMQQAGVMKSHASARKGGTPLNHHHPHTCPFPSPHLFPVSSTLLYQSLELC